MDIYTGMAVDAFRKQESLRRRLAKAQNEALAAQRRMPRNEMQIWFVATEIIRIENDIRESQDAHDQESIEESQALLVPLRAQLRELDREPVRTMQDVIAEAAARPGTFGYQPVKPGDTPHGSVDPDQPGAG